MSRVLTFFKAAAFYKAGQAFINRERKIELVGECGGGLRRAVRLHAPVHL
jgi:hypothetical protein